MIYQPFKERFIFKQGLLCKEYNLYNIILADLDQLSFKQGNNQPFDALSVIIKMILYQS